MRGSSEFHAWGGSNLYLRRNGDDITLTVEHRAAPSVPTVSLSLASAGDALALQVIEPTAPVEPPAASADERITAALAGADQPLSVPELRSASRIRTATLYARLAVLSEQGLVTKSTAGYERSRE